MKQSSRHRSATTADADRTAPTLSVESEEAAAPAIDAASLATPDRLGSIDAYRGLVMLLMLAEVLRLSAVAASFPDSRVWQLLGHHQSHVEWVGCALHDLIQPSFTFLVGVSLPFSLASRRRRGQSLGRMAVHALWRSILLVLLGIFLRSLGHTQTNFTFEDTLTQIGLGYCVLFVVSLLRVGYQWLVLVLLLLGYWLAFVLYPVPAADFDWQAVGVPVDWPHHLQGFAAHWDKNSNLAWAADRWFLNLFPREEPFAFNGGGYSTLSFIPTLGTMILGLLAGGWLQADILPRRKILRLLLAAGAGLGAGWLLNWTGVCPNVKRIWTPGWALFSGGWCCLLLAGFYTVIDVWRWRWWAFPLTVVGMNSITAYLMEWLAVPFVADALNRHLGADFFQRFGEAYEPLFRGACILVLLWFVLLAMYRRKIFLRI